MKNFYKDKWVWITGASSGIGREIAKQVANSGAKVLLASRNTTELENLSKEWKLEKGRFQVIKLDLEDYKSLEKITEDTIRTIGVPDVLIHNGGISQRSLTKETDLKTVEKLIFTNFLGSVAITLAILKNLPSKKKLSLGVISSVAGRIGTPLRCGYSASKFALAGFYQALRAESEKDGIHVSMVYPGWIKTDISKNAVQGDGTATGIVDSIIEKGISVEKCATTILSGMATGKREILIAGRRERFGLFLQKYFPSLFFKKIQKAKVR
jgi:dehydrogenase/reductase SDR family protein 7B